MIYPQFVYVPFLDQVFAFQAATTHRIWLETEEVKVNLKYRVPLSEVIKSGQIVLLK